MNLYDCVQRPFDYFNSLFVLARTDVRFVKKSVSCIKALHNIGIFNCFAKIERLNFPPQFYCVYMENNYWISYNERSDSIKQYCHKICPEKRSYCAQCQNCSHKLYLYIPTVPKRLLDKGELRPPLCLYR